MAVRTQPLAVVGLVVPVVAVCDALGWGTCARDRRDGLLLVAVAALVFLPALAVGVGRNRPAGVPPLAGGLKTTPGSPALGGRVAPASLETPGPGESVPARRNE